MEKRNDFSDFLCNFVAKFRKDPELMDNGNSLIIITTMEQSIENLYKLDGRVPVGKALPFGLQHVLAMFVSNIAPIMILAGAIGLDSSVSAVLIQNCMVIAGIGTLVQLYPVWRIGSRLPIVMGISFTFLSLAIAIAGAHGMGTLVGAVIIGGLVEGTLGLFAKYWIKLIPPVVAATVVTAIGFSLLPVGANSFAGGQGAADFGSMNNFKKTGKTISESQAECLCERVKYNSWYVQQYCFFLWSHTDKEVSQELLDNQLQLVLDTNEDLFLTEMDELTPTQIGMLKAIASGEKHFNAKDVVEKYGLGQPQSITRNKKVLVEKDLVEKHLQDFSFVDPVFELWLKREYNILPSWE
jgi:uncharacterized protein (DUF697 family)